MEANCARITGFFGTNSSGKSSILQLLLMLKQTKDGTDRAVPLDLNGDLVRLGTITDVLHKQDRRRSLEWRLTFSHDKEIIRDERMHVESLKGRKEFTIISANSAKRDALSTTKLSYLIGDHEFSLTRNAKQQSDYELACKTRLDPIEFFNFIRNPGRPWPLPGPIKSYAFPDKARTYFHNADFLADLETAYEERLDKIYYLGPLRIFPQRNYLRDSSRPTDVGRHGENAIQAIIAATEAKEPRNLKKKSKLKNFQEMIAYWLQEMGLAEQFRVEEIAGASNLWQPSIRTGKESSEVYLTDVGFGISQVLPAIVLLQYVPEGSTVMLEQPEIHLHPLAQAGLADVVIHAATNRKLQILFESHSEHLLLRLQRRVAEEKVSSDDVKLYFCDFNCGESELEDLDLDSTGNIRNWPDKFMGDAFNETAEAQLARLRRRERDV